MNPRGQCANRPRRHGRRPAFLNPKPTILVVTEGEVTEREYILAFKDAYRNPRVTVEVAEEHGVPKTLVRIAKHYKEEADAKASREEDENLAFDSVWCVFDIDDHPAVGETKMMARDNGIHLAISNPCIELWLLLHFGENPGMQDRATMERKLKKFVPKYDKHVDYGMYATGYSHAVARAERWIKTPGRLMSLIGIQRRAFTNSPS